MKKSPVSVEYLKDAHKRKLVAFSASRCKYHRRLLSAGKCRVSKRARARQRETVALLLLLLADLVSLHLHHSLETHGEVRPIEVPILVFTDLLEAEQLRRTMHCAQA